MQDEDPPALSQPYWDGLKQGRLLVQRCLACGSLRHYPRPVCPSCFSMEADWAEIAGHGVIHTWTVTWHPFAPALRDQLPLVLVTVDLPAGVRVHAPLRGQPPEDIRMGQPVRLVFERTATDVVLPAFVPDA